MSRNKNNNGKYDKAALGAKKNASITESTNKVAANPAESQVPGINGHNDFLTLTALCPNTDTGFEQLSEFQAGKLVHLVMQYIDRLCEKRGSKIEQKYWKKITRKILNAPSRKQAYVIAARAGSGKSTWIYAFLLALCELYFNKDSLAEALGGVVLVLQKVESINGILDTIDYFFPGRSDEVMVALQGWSKSGKDRGYCQNQSVESFEACQKRQCPYAADCKVLTFEQKAQCSFIIGMTQARFDMLRNAPQGVEKLMHRISGLNTAVPRRFLIFDEKFEMAQTIVLDRETINRASNDLERLGRERDVVDSKIHQMQKKLSFHVMRLYEELREQTRYSIVDKEADIPFGLCTLAGKPAHQKESFRTYYESFKGYNSSFASQAVRNCLLVTQELYEGDCLFFKSRGFGILRADPQQLFYGQAQTIIFDATAGADGDYRFCTNVDWLPESPARHMDKVTFHLFEHPDLNVSHSAMRKSWKLPALATLVKEIVESFEAPAFLCTYKEFSQYLWDMLPESIQSHLEPMPNREEACLPYFGGTNGDNNFNMCANVILLGYPRLDPQTYLCRTYAACRDNGCAQEIDQVSKALQIDNSNPKDAIRRLKTVEDYQNMHLAARLEQEIYRCTLRNAECEDEIHIFMFRPPEQVLKLLYPRFKGCRVDHISELPQCVAFYKIAHGLIEASRLRIANWRTFFHNGMESQSNPVN